MTVFHSSFSETPTARIKWVQRFTMLMLVALALTGMFDLWLEENERAFNLHHLIAGLGVGLFFIAGRIVLPPWQVTAFFITLFFVSFLAAIQHTLHPMTLNALYCFYLCLLGLLCRNGLTHDALRKALHAAAWVILIAITVKDVFYFHEIMDALSTMNDRVFIPSVVAGGLNLEASFALLAAVFLRGTRAYWPAFAGALFLAILYSSRAAILTCGALFLYEMLSTHFRATLLARPMRLTLLLMVGSAALLLALTSPVTQFALSRFEDIGYEPGSEGRLVLWQLAPQVFINHPFGVGAGNAIHEIENLLGRSVNEDNLHNIYLQILVDLGIVGFAAYAAMVWATLRRAAKGQHDNPLWIVIGLYFLMGFSQFRAYDPAFFFWLGLAWHDTGEEAA